MTLHRIQVSGSGMPTTETEGCRSGSRGGPAAPPREQNALCLSRRSARLRPPLALMEARAQTLALRRCPAGRSPQVRPPLQARTPAARPPSSRRAARLASRCITGQQPIPFTTQPGKLMQLTPCFTQNALGHGDVQTYSCSIQIRLRHLKSIRH